MPRPKPTLPTHNERRQRFLDALRAAGGELNRTRVREAVHPAFRAAAFDELAAELVAEGLITAEKTLQSHRHLVGHNVPHHVTLYRLTDRGRDLGGEQVPWAVPPEHPIRG